MSRNQILTCFCLLTLLFFANPLQNNPLVLSNNLQTPTIEKDIDVSALSVGDAVFTWTARDSPTPSEFLTDEIEGDHITIHATSTDFPVMESQLYMDSWMTFDADIISNIDDGFNPYSDNIPMHDYHFTWLVIGGIELGTPIHIVFNFDTTNCDVMAWRGDTNVSNWYYSSNSLKTTMATTTNPELSHLDWPVTIHGSMYFAIYNHGTTPGYGNLVFYREEYTKVDADGETVSYDTYGEPGNIIKPVLYVAKLGADSRSYGYIPTTSFVNYFHPQVEILTPNEGDNWTIGQHNVTWIAADRNSDDTIWFELFLYVSEFEYSNLGTGNFNFDSQHGFYYHTIDSNHASYSDEFSILIVAHDNDSTNPLDWPNFQTTNTSGYFEFGNSQPIPEVWPIVHDPADIQFTEGEVGHSLIWTVVCDYIVDYAIWLNNTIIIEGRWTEGTIDLSLDDLLPGIYNYRLDIAEAPSGYVTVTVLSNSTSFLPTGPTVQPPPLSPITFVNIGLVGFIVIVIILILKQKEENN